MKETAGITRREELLSPIPRKGSFILNVPDMETGLPAAGKNLADRVRP
jgi:hypothetical protein